MLAIFIVLYLAFGFSVHYWFRNEPAKLRELVKSCTYKFLAIFALQGLTLLIQNVFVYKFIYNDSANPYAHLVFQLTLDVFPLFDLLTPCAFILYTHHVNFRNDEILITEEYDNYKSKRSLKIDSNKFEIGDSEEFLQRIQTREFD